MPQVTYPINHGVKIETQILYGTNFVCFTIIRCVFFPLKYRNFVKRWSRGREWVVVILYAGSKQKVLLLMAFP